MLGILSINPDKCSKEEEKINVQRLEEKKSNCLLDNMMVYNTKKKKK